MRTTILLLLVASALFLATPATADVAPCDGEPPAELVRCGIGGHRVYVCGDYVTNYCIWGP